MKRAFVLVLLTINAACTGMLWEKDSYIEHVGGFYLEENSNTLVAIGERFHYIFKVDKNLAGILNSSRSISFSPTFWAFYVNENNNVSGGFVLKVRSETLTKDEISLLTNLGFRDLGVNKYAELRYDATIRGQRFMASNSFGNIVKFEHAYQIKVIVPYGDGAIASKVAMTPVTAVTDTVLVIPLGVLYGVFQIFNQP